MEGSCEFLTREEVIEINRLGHEDSGGLHDGGDNLANPDPLDYILEAIQGPIFGVDRYPSVISKAAALAYTIITRHAFKDGNKRAGIQACLIMLELNSYAMSLLPLDETLEITLRVAAGSMSLEEFTAWVEGRTSKV